MWPPWRVGSRRRRNGTPSRRQKRCLNALESSMLKRNGKPIERQISLFGNDDELSYERQTTNRVRSDGKKPLDGVSTEDGGAVDRGGATGGGALRGAGDYDSRNGNALPDLGAGAEADAATGRDAGVGDDPGEIYSPSAGRRRQPLNTANYRICVEDA